MQDIIVLEKEIQDIISNSPVETDLAHARLDHSRSTREWVLKLKPDADMTLQIAALAHDIERALRPDYYESTKNKFDDYG
ncbi:hypothetical protein ACFL96_19770 [Thermoproteota archaeon]